jgi:hypothetical protein
MWLKYPEGHAGQVKDDGPDTGIPWSSRLGVGREANNLTLYKSSCHETSQMPRMVAKRNTRKEEMSWGDRRRRFKEARILDGL